jgi:hypothetical protein
VVEMVEKSAKAGDHDDALPFICVVCPGKSSMSGVRALHDHRQSVSIFFHRPE